jgi:hypothetical protein
LARVDIVFGSMPQHACPLPSALCPPPPQAASGRIAIRRQYTSRGEVIDEPAFEPDAAIPGASAVAGLDRLRARAADQTRSSASSTTWCSCRHMGSAPIEGRQDMGEKVII